MTKKQKFTQEELDQIQNLQQSNARMISEFGQIELEILLTNQRIKLLSQTKDNAIKQFESLQEEEKKLVKKLNEKYGTGVIDIQNGEFTPSK